MVSMAAWLISLMVRLRLLLMMPWNWNAWRVVSLMVPLANCVARRSVSSHCARSGHAARHADADHERIGLFQLVLAAVGAQVAVVLLIGAVELEQLLVVLGHRAGGLVGKSLGDGAAQVVAADLDVFVGGEFLFFDMVKMEI